MFYNEHVSLGITHMKCFCKQNVVKNKPKNAATAEEKMLSQMMGCPAVGLVGIKMAY